MIMTHEIVKRDDKNHKYCAKIVNHSAKGNFLLLIIFMVCFTFLSKSRVYGWLVVVWMVVVAEVWDLL